MKIYCYILLFFLISNTSHSKTVTCLLDQHFKYHDRNKWEDQQVPYQMNIFKNRLELKRLDSVNEEKDKIERELKAKLEELLEIKSKNEKQTAELLNSNIVSSKILNKFENDSSFEMKFKIEIRHGFE